MGASWMNSFDPSRGIAAMMGTPDAGAKEEQRLLSNELTRRRITRAGQQIDEGDRAAAASTPEAIDEAISMETGAPVHHIRAIREAVTKGLDAVVPGTEFNVGQDGQPSPTKIEQGIVDRVRASSRRNMDPLSRTHPDRVANAQGAAGKEDRTARLFQDAINGKMPRDTLNTAVGVNAGRPHEPFAVQGGDVINKDTGALGASTMLSQSQQGLNLARGQTEQSRQRELESRMPANAALARQRDSRAGLNDRTDPNRPRTASSSGGPLTPDQERKLRVEAERVAKQRGLSGRAADEFVSDYMDNPRKTNNEPVSGTTPSESVRREFGADPKNKGRRLGAYERGQGYAVYEGKKLIGYVREAQ